MMSDAKAIVEEFCTLCTSVRMDYDLYRSLFETGRRNLDLYTSTAPLCFHDLNRILIAHLVVQFSKITDPAKSQGQSNLTTNYILEEIHWPDDVRQKLREVNERLMAFRGKIKSARNKRSAHFDLIAQIERREDLGEFPKGDDEQFLRDLETFVSIAYGHVHDGRPISIEPAISTDTHQLVRALEKSVVLDRCSKCDAGERAVAVLDYADRSE